MSIVAVHGPHTFGDSEDQAASVGIADNLAFQEHAGAATGTAYAATVTWDSNSAFAGAASASSEAFQPTRVTGY